MNGPAAPRARRVLVLGGTRFIGAAIVRRLVRSGCSVMLVHRGVHERDPDQAVHLHAERSALRDHATEIARFAPDAAIDSAAMTEGDATHATSLLAGLVPRVIVLSSLDVYCAYELLRCNQPGAIDPVPLAETAPLRESRFPRRDRARSPDDTDFSYDKLDVENVYRSCAALDTTILRLPFVYGPGDHRRRVDRVLDALHGCGGRLTLPRTQSGWRCTRAFVEDIASVVELTLGNARASNRTFNVGEQTALSELAWVRAIAGAAKWNGEIDVDDADPGPDAPSWRQDLVLDTTLVREGLGWAERRSVRENVAATVGRTTRN